MLSWKNYVGLICSILIFVTVNAAAVQHLTLDSTEWTNFKTLYGKTYINQAAEVYALYTYNYNSKLIALHNQLYARGLRTYSLAVNQFTDMRLSQFNALFPVATPLSVSYNSALPSVLTAPDSFNPVDELGLNITAQNQGYVCGSGWAYASAKSIEVKHGYQLTNPLDYEVLSAQNLIDCAGSGKGCGGQVAQVAFDYLSQNDRVLYLESDYPNNPTSNEQGMCLPPDATATMAEVSVSSYGEIADGNDVLLRQYVSSYPAVIEFNPTSFEFMHYSEGIFQQPRTSSGSHFMTVIGYGSALNNLQQQQDYWLVVNSFGPEWGENGFMRFARTATTPIAKSTILPLVVT